MVYKLYIVLLICLCGLLTSCKEVMGEPSFYLLGESEYELYRGETFDDPGFVALADNDISDSVTIDSQLDVMLPGTYTITYVLTYEDSVYTLVRRVIVINELKEYFNQVPPGIEPVIFAPGFITSSSTSEFAGTFSRDYKYYFFTRRNNYNVNRLYYSEYVDGEWTYPSMSPISDDVAEFEPHVTPDNKYLYFGSMRDGNTSLVIFRSEYIDGSWSDPVFVNNGLNDGFAMYISVSDSQNIYYTTMEGIYVMKYIDGEYIAGVPTGITGAHSFIAPDESYMLLDDSGQNQTTTSIFITFNDEGSWTTPIKLDESINQEGFNQICASISPDGKYLFFSRFETGSADIYWVDISILDQYRP